MKKILLILIIVFCGREGISQFYPLEAGGHGGYSSGICFRAYLEESLSYEALSSFRYEGVQLHLFRQQHQELQMTEAGNFYFVYGYGAHVGFYRTDHYKIFMQEVYFSQKIFTPLAGIDGYASLEFRFEELPVSVGLTYKPYMELSLRSIFGVNLWDFGVTLKYRFKPDNVYY